MAMTYLDGQLEAFPDQATYFSQMADSWQKKLWHQMGDVLLQVINEPFFTKGTGLLDLHTNFVKGFSDKLSEIAYSRFCVAASRQFDDAKQAIDFLEEIVEKVQSDPQAELLRTMECATRHISTGDLDGAKALLSAGRTAIDRYTGIMEGSIQSVYYLASLKYHKAKGNLGDYFKSAILFLQYSPLEEISEEAQLQLAKDVSFAALTGKTIFNFGELLAHPLLNVLDNSPYEWLKKLLFAFNSGDISAVSIIEEHVGDHPVLGQNSEFVNEKIRIMALMEMVFHRASASRSLSFASIAETCDVKVDQVEWLLMKSFSLGVLRGIIDQVAQEVQVKWIQPRVLDVNQINTMKVRLGDWTKSLDETSHFLQQNAPDLL